MQIFEVTYGPKKKVREALGGIVKALGSAATAAAGQYVQSKTGVDTSKVGANPYGAQETQAAAAAKPVIAQQAKQQQTLWNTAINKMQQTQNVMSPLQLNATSKAELGRSLRTQLHRNLLQNKLGSDYRRLPDFVDKTDPDAQAKAKQIVTDIDTALSGINGALVKTRTATQSQLDWGMLAQAAYDAMSLVQFRPSTGYGGSGGRSTAAAGQQQNPVQAAQTKLTQTTGLTPSMLAQIQSITGALPTVRSSDPQVQAYLAALGFKP